jgi:hypothetical protein
MNFLKGLVVIILIGIAINIFTKDDDKAKTEWCKDKKCSTCGSHIGCYGYKYDFAAGLVIGPDNSLNKCKSCADKGE